MNGVTEKDGREGEGLVRGFLHGKSKGYSFGSNGTLYTHRF